MSDKTSTSDPKDKSKDTSEKKQCISLKEASVQTVTLAFDLFDAAVLSSPQLLIKVLEDKAVQEAIKNGLQAAGKQLMTDQEAGKPVEFGGTMAMLTRAAATSMKPAAQKTAIAEIKKTREYQQFDAGLKEFKCAFEQSPVGVFVEKHKGLLIVVGAVGALAGGVAMYYAKAGDMPAKGFSFLSKLKPVKLGAISLHADKVVFKPSDRKIDVTLDAKGNWESVKANLELSSSFKNDALVGAGAKSQVVVTLNPKTSVTFGANGSWTAAEADKRRTLAGSLQLEGTRQLSKRSTLSMRVYADYNSGATTQSSKTGGSVTYTRQDPFGKGTSVKVSGEGSTGYTQNVAPQVQPARKVDEFMLKLELGF